MAACHPISVERLRLRVHYAPATGELVSLRTGKTYAHRDSEGYLAFRVDGRTLYGHRVAAALVHGEWPAGVVDHMNGDRADNRWSNLRVVSQQLNRQNMRGPHRDSATGLLGVTSEGGRFKAQLYVAGKNVRLGAFDTAQEAHDAYLQAKRRQHAGCQI